MNCCSGGVTNLKIAKKSRMAQSVRLLARIAPGAVLCVAAFSCLAAFGQQQPPLPAKGISGRITESAGGSPTASPSRRGVPGARVLVVRGYQNLKIGSQTDTLVCDAVVADVTTNDQGTYFADVPAGNYTVIVWKQHYEPRRAPSITAPGAFNGSIARSTLSSAAHEYLQIPGSQGNNNNEVTVAQPKPPAKGISGKITESAGGSPTTSPARRGLAGAQVLIVRGLQQVKSGSQVDVVYCGSLVTKANTNAQGEFFADVPTGTYDIVVWKERYEHRSERSVTAPGLYNGSIAKAKLSSNTHEYLQIGDTTSSETKANTIEGLWDTTIPGTVRVQLEFRNTAKGWSGRFLGRNGWEAMADLTVDSANRTISWRRPLGWAGEPDQRYSATVAGTSMTGVLQPSTNWVGKRIGDAAGK
jgi:hypothetical protein